MKSNPLLYIVKGKVIKLPSN